MKSRRHDGTLEMYHANSRLERNRNLQLLYQRHYVTTNGYVPADASTNALSLRSYRMHTEHELCGKLHRVTVYKSPPALYSRRRVDDMYFSAVLNTKIRTKIDIKYCLYLVFECILSA